MKTFIIKFIILLFCAATIVSAQYIMTNIEVKLKGWEEWYMTPY